MVMPAERLKLEVRVHFAELLDDLGSLVLGEEASHAVGDAAGCANERVLGLVVDALQAKDTLHHGRRVAEVLPRLLPGGILVNRHVGAGVGIFVEDLGLLELARSFTTSDLFLALLATLLALNPTTVTLR